MLDALLIGLFLFLFLTIGALYVMTCVLVIQWLWENVRDLFL